jgi:hypothetical protein
VGRRGFIENLQGVGRRVQGRRRPKGVQVFWGAVPLPPQRGAGQLRAEAWVCPRLALATLRETPEVRDPELGLPISNLCSRYIRAIFKVLDNIDTDPSLPNHLATKDREP